ncbi:hypothetical protein JCM17846_27130 [Iodidimonas nitroreducens]|uniref:DUF1499 domain-containing protein n=1 Tax=Iodidimonas nitroreducens TaxID=1236968 RepID=A0A5A7N9K0_9PROT|nr:DUF1499 domain-containing protein [Iodidimonas nitroreducens]GAK34238.1 hypothetical protein AQ1_02135 [alpha proteobacterium Q-1]GER05031.1 hypothetical protein JCM17846_27130 [Iodidimonas nitroreducens]
MSIIDAIRYTAIALSILIVIVGLGLLFMTPAQLESIFGTKPLPEIDFATLKRPDSPNTYLLCPLNTCLQSTPDQIAPVFEANPEQLRDRILEFVDKSPNIQTRTMDPANAQYDFIERTPVMRFPDIITVRIYPAGDGGSTLAIYSRSVYGHSDLGANRKRVERWLAVISPAS